MILTRSQLLGHDPTPAWSARVALLCPGESADARDVLRATLDAVHDDAPESAWTALDIARRASDGVIGDCLVGASAYVRRVHDTAAGATERESAEAHESRFRRPWAEEHDAKLAAAVAAVYAVVAYYVRAAWGWR